MASEEMNFFWGVGGGGKFNLLVAMAAHQSNSAVCTKIIHLVEQEDYSINSSEKL